MTAQVGQAIVPAAAFQAAGVCVRPEGDGLPGAVFGRAIALPGGRDLRQSPRRLKAGGHIRTIALILLFALAVHAAPQAQSTPSIMGIQINKTGDSLSVPMQIVIMLTLLTLLPALVMSITPFLRIAIVLHFLRQALGTQSVPSNQVMVGIALFLTFLIIGPVATDMYHQGWEPMQNNTLTTSQAFDQGVKPLKAFLVKFAREKDVKLFLEITKSPAPHTPADLDLRILIPAYILSELKAGFQIGAVLFLPFLIIDLVVASVTLSIGMVQLPPVMISAPFKILLFVLADGWNLVIGSLMKGFYI